MGDVLNDTAKVLYNANDGNQKKTWCQMLILKNGLSTNCICWHFLFQEKQKGKLSSALIRHCKYAGEIGDEFPGGE